MQPLLASGSVNCRIHRPQHILLLPVSLPTMEPLSLAGSLGGSDNPLMGPEEGMSSSTLCLTQGSQHSL